MSQPACTSSNGPAISLPRGIMITNDDGPPGSHAPFILPFTRVLQQYLNQHAAATTTSSPTNIFVCTPAEQQSWTGKQITRWGEIAVHQNWKDQTHAAELVEQARVKAATDAGDEHDIALWSSVNGSPATACNVGLTLLNPFRRTATAATSSPASSSTNELGIDLVISGPNLGRNTGRSFMLSSGTIGAACEASLVKGVKSIALSFAYGRDVNEYSQQEIRTACQLAVNVIMNLYRHWPKQPHLVGIDLFNINVPLNLQNGLNTRVMMSHAVNDTVGALYRPTPHESSKSASTSPSASPVVEKALEARSSATTASGLHHTAITPLIHSLTLQFHVDFSLRPTTAHNWHGSDLWCVQNGLVSVTPFSSSLAECIHTHPELESIATMYPPEEGTVCAATLLSTTILPPPQPSLPISPSSSAGASVSVSSSASKPPKMCGTYVISDSRHPYTYSPGEYVDFRTLADGRWNAAQVLTNIKDTHGQVSEIVVRAQGQSHTISSHEIPFLLAPYGTYSPGGHANEDNDEPVAEFRFHDTVEVNFAPAGSPPFLLRGEVEDKERGGQIWVCPRDLISFNNEGYLVHPKREQVKLIQRGGAAQARAAQASSGPKVRTEKVNNVPHTSEIAAYLKEQMSKPPTTASTPSSSSSTAIPAFATASASDAPPRDEQKVKHPIIDYQRRAKIKESMDALKALVPLEPNRNSNKSAVPVTAALLSPSKFEFQSQLDLNSIRDTLIRLEESIIFSLIERAQFKLNDAIYQPIEQLIPAPTTASSPTTSATALSTKEGGSLLTRFLASTESLHATVRRYTSPCEHPFSNLNSLPAPILPQLQYPQTIKENQINHNERIMKFYIETILPAICSAGDDSNYGSSCVCDVQALQLLSKRIHYGKFVAESKFLSDRDTFTAAIRARDIPALTNLITKPIVELQVLERVRSKAATYGRSPDTNGSPPPTDAPYKISPVVIGQLYERIMTMTKDIQIEYLLGRLD